MTGVSSSAANALNAVTATHLVRVPVTTVWTGPGSPRPVDGPAVADEPDVAAWLAALDTHAADDESGAWSHVVAPWQLSPEDARGYPGWVRSAHLSPATDDVVQGPVPTLDPTDPREGGATHPAVAEARRHLGLPYLWSGVSPLGFDCSGLVLHTWRLLGVVVARDAYAQAEFASPVELDAVQAGDLYFFARPGRRIHHVGIVVRPGRMVHASETGGVLVEEDLPADRVATLVAAGRLPMP